MVYGAPLIEAYASILVPCGYKREFWVEKYRLDFAHPYAKVNIELDGPWHYPNLDAERDAFLRALGWRIIRIRHD